MLEPIDTVYLIRELSFAFTQVADHNVIGVSLDSGVSVGVSLTIRTHKFLFRVLLFKMFRKLLELTASFSVGSLIGRRNAFRFGQRTLVSYSEELRS